MRVRARKHVRRNEGSRRFKSAPLGQRVRISGASQHAEIARVWGFIRLCRLSRDLLTVGNVGLEHSNGARDQQYAILSEMKICTTVSSFAQRARRGASVGPKVELCVKAIKR